MGIKPRERHGIFRAFRVGLIKINDCELEQADK